MGLKTEGSDFPSPHSELVKVLGPKWRNMAISVSCHESCWEVGMGRSGSGGGGWRRESEEGREKVRRKMKNGEMGWWCCGYLMRFLLGSTMEESQNEESIVVFVKMLEDEWCLVPDVATVVTVFLSCAGEGDVEMGKKWKLEEDEGRRQLV